MYTKWTEHLNDQEDKARFERLIVSCKPVLDRQLALLKQEEQALDRSEMDVRSFDQPNWDYRQAYKNGYRAALNVSKRLIDLDQQRTTNDQHNGRPSTG